MVDAATADVGEGGIDYHSSTMPRTAAPHHH
jgi:hypothetical protein